MFRKTLIVIESVVLASILGIKFMELLVSKMTSIYVFFHTQNDFIVTYMWYVWWFLFICACDLRQRPRFKRLSRYSIHFYITCMSQHLTGKQWSNFWIRPRFSYTSLFQNFSFLNPVILCWKFDCWKRTKLERTFLNTLERA